MIGRRPPFSSPLTLISFSFRAHVITGSCLDSGFTMESTLWVRTQSFGLDSKGEPTVIKTRLLSTCGTWFKSSAWFYDFARLEPTGWFIGTNCLVNSANKPSCRLTHEGHWITLLPFEWKEGTRLTTLNSDSFAWNLQSETRSHSLSLRRLKAETVSGDTKNPPLSQFFVSRSTDLTVDPTFQSAYRRSQDWKVVHSN